VCKRSYIHSGILTLAENGIFPSLMSKLEAKKKRRTGLTQNEIRLMAFLSHLEEDSSLLTNNIEPVEKAKKAVAKQSKAKPDKAKAGRKAA